MEKFALDTKVSGLTLEEYMSKLLEKNEKNQIEIERGKLAVSLLKQMNNRSRLLLDAAKFELKCREFAKEAAEALEAAARQETNKDGKEKQVA